MGFVMRMGAFSAIALGFPAIQAPFSAIATTLRETKNQLLHEMFFNSSWSFNHFI